MSNGYDKPMSDGMIETFDHKQNGDTLKLSPMFTTADHEYAHERGICVDSCPHCAQARSQNASNNVGAQGCVATPPNIFDGKPIPLGPWVLTDTLQERGNKYGGYSNMSALAQAMKKQMRASDNWDSLPPWEAESLEMIVTKIARILTGDQRQQDSWHDIQGYAKLAEDRVSIATAAGGGLATP